MQNKTKETALAILASSILDASLVDTLHAITMLSVNSKGGGVKLKVLINELIDCSIEMGDKVRTERESAANPPDSLEELLGLLFSEERSDE